jgi:general secretion pathway protein G
MSEPRECHKTEIGFTLIELLIVVVVLGILAAVVILNLSDTVSQASVSSCNSDAKSVEVAVEAFHNNPNNTALLGQYPDLGPTGQLELTDPASDHYGGPYLRSWPRNGSHYAITLDGGSVGQVDVNGTNYDGSTDPCASVA